MNAASQAALLKARSPILSIQQAVSLEGPEASTLRAGVYRNQAHDDGLISQVQFEQLTSQASSGLRDWAPMPERSPRQAGRLARITAFLITGVPYLSAIAVNIDLMDVAHPQQHPFFTAQPALEAELTWSRSQVSQATGRVLGD